MAPLDMSRLDVIEPSLISDVMRLSAIQLPNPLHRYTADTANSSQPSQSDNLRKMQREIDEEISEVSKSHFYSPYGCMTFSHEFSQLVARDQSV